MGVWATPYGNLRDIFNLKNAASGSATLTAAQKSAALGFAKTLEGLELLYVISTRDTLGAVVEIKQDASDLAAFVSRDSVYKYILNTLDEGNTALAAGGKDNGAPGLRPDYHPHYYGAFVIDPEGNNVEAGKATLAASGLAITNADGLTDAAQKIVAAVKAT